MALDLFDLLGAGTNLISGYLASKAAKDAAQAQEQRQVQAAGNLRPYAELGDYAAGELQGRLTNNALLKPFSLEDFQTSPGYQFRLNEGLKQGERGARARGKRYSGATEKGLQRYAQDYAANEYDAAYNRDNINKTRQYNFLAGPINAGQGAQATVGGFLGNAGDAAAAGRVGSSNAMLGGVQSAYDVLADARYGRNPYGAAPYVYRTGP